ncbi:MAG: cell division protein CrgA [Dermabacter sp.]|nr:cell division protein CrgA [Dermabacter sp.]
MAKKVRRSSTIPAQQNQPARDRVTRAEAETRRSRRAQESAAEAYKPSPAWLVPTAVTLLILGILYMVVYYISSAQFPLPIGDWNLAVGIGILLAGGGLLTFWR